MTDSKYILAEWISGLVVLVFVMVLPWVWVRDRALMMLVAVGVGIFALPAAMLMDRRPAVRTVMSVVPDVTAPGQRVEVQWSVQVLRSGTFGGGCSGYVHRKIIDSSGHEFGYSSIDSIIHGEVGTTGHYRVEWLIPTGIAGGPAVIRRNTERWCNLLQKWFWPIHELHEAYFTVVS